MYSEPDADITPDKEGYWIFLPVDEKGAFLAHIWLFGLNIITEEGSSDWRRQGLSHRSHMIWHKRVDSNRWRYAAPVASFYSTSRASYGLTLSRPVVPRQTQCSPIPTTRDLDPESCLVCYVVSSSPRGPFSEGIDDGPDHHRSRVGVISGVALGWIRMMTSDISHHRQRHGYNRGYGMAAIDAHGFEIGTFSHLNETLHWWNWYCPRFFIAHIYHDV